ncbi:MAG: substrate-binding domain-containing protein [Candidatus Carbobacillus altaicus]|nr:substrate-binding domain-containing protein [Candidatus Carbobacillus altaicus]
MKRIVALILGLAIIIGVILLIRQTIDPSGLTRLEQVTVRGYYGSEKADFLADPDVQAHLKKTYRITLDLKKMGSMEMASLNPEEPIDILWPSSEIPVTAIENRFGTKVKKNATIAYSPMIIGTWKSLVPILKANDLVQSSPQDQMDVLRLEKLLMLTVDGRTWSDLAANDAYAVRKTIVVKTTDPKRSNSGLLFLAMSANILSGKSVVTSMDAPALAEKLKLLFQAQGFQSKTSSLPWEDYLNKGRGDTPLVWAYEAQMVETLSRYGSRRGGDELYLLYPSPTIWSNHVLISLSDGGNRLLTALLEDAFLQKKLNEYGFRNQYQNGDYFLTYYRNKGLELPATFDDVATLPTYETMEKLLKFLP